MEMNQFEKLLKHFLSLKHDQNFYLELQSRPLDYLDEELETLAYQAWACGYEGSYDYEEVVERRNTPDKMRMHLRSIILLQVADSMFENVLVQRYGTTFN